MNYGTNADHARNSLTNCGKRQLEYGDKRIHFIHTRKRGKFSVEWRQAHSHYTHHKRDTFSEEWRQACSLNAHLQTK